MNRVSLHDYYPTLPFDLVQLPHEQDALKHPLFGQISEIVYDRFGISETTLLDEIKPSRRAETMVGAAVMGDCVVGGIIYERPKDVVQAQMLGTVTYLVARLATIKGVGVALAAACENDLFETGVKRVRLEADIDAVPFWENRGFESKPTDETSMVKLLNPTSLIDPTVRFAA